MHVLVPCMASQQAIRGLAQTLLHVPVEPYNACHHQFYLYHAQFVMLILSLMLCSSWPSVAVATFDSSCSGGYTARFTDATSSELHRLAKWVSVGREF